MYAAYESMEMLGKVSVIFIVVRDQYVMNLAKNHAKLPSQVINKTLRENGTLWNGSNLASEFLNRTFDLSYEDAFIDAHGERRSNYCISGLDLVTKLYQVRRNAANPPN